MNRHRYRPFWLALFLTPLLIGATSNAFRAADAPAPVYILLWFDTEDYLLPASDDAALHIATFLSRENIRATFKVVGEKARTLEQRQRTDVIAALKKHEIGYHSNFHSVEPTPALYLSRLGWDEGVAEFDRRERPGKGDVERIFGVTPRCYGQPGSSWGPQVFGTMRRWRMPVYLDAGNHVDVEGRPCYYGGILNLYHLKHLMRANLTNNDTSAAEARFLEARKQLQGEGGGVISIMYHPCEFVHKQFWDGVNFRSGANPPRTAWKQPPQKTAAETQLAYDVFERYIHFLKRFPEVRFITALDAARLYADKARNHAFAREEINGLATAVSGSVSYQIQGDYALSASEVFCLLNGVVAHPGDEWKSKKQTLPPTPFGPADPVSPLTSSVRTTSEQFQRTALDVEGYLARHGRVPATVWLGSVPVPPESYLVAVARVAREILDGKPVPEVVDIQPATLAAADYVAKDALALWRWVIFPPGFSAPEMMQLAKRQAWTLKPALLTKERK